MCLISFCCCCCYCCWNLSLQLPLPVDDGFSFFLFFLFLFFSSIVRSFSRSLVPVWKYVCECFFSFYHLKLFAFVWCYSFVLFCLFTLIWWNISKANQHDIRDKIWTLRTFDYIHMANIIIAVYIKTQGALSRAHTIGNSKITQ